MSRLRKITWFYRPYTGYLVADCCALVVSFFVVLMWFPLATQMPFEKYDVFALVFSASWLFFSYFCHRYIRVKRLKMGQSLARLGAASLLTFGLMCGYMWLRSGRTQFSIYVLLTIWTVMVVASIVYLSLSHAYRYATYAEPELERAPERGPQSVLHPKRPVEKERYDAVRQSIVENIGERATAYLESKVDLISSNTFTSYTAEIYNFQKLKYYRFDTIVNFMPLNQIRGINQMLGLINDKLPDDGLIVLCFEPKSTTKKKILDNYPPVINWIVYTIFYLYKRVLPKTLMTQRLYFDITEGRNRVLTHLEVFGRLYYCGFELVDDKKIDGKMYVIARRVFRPQTVATRLYGIFVKLNRVGKDGKMFRVYKFRTMHPYSEYLQAYIYQTHSLREGGKFSHDVRVNNVGHFMRKYWLDELPMVLNLIKGDMKLVGVRPISKQYYSLYSPELQEKRTHHKPGLLPPFYADLPKTLDEIQASEMRYLTMCEEKGTFHTDFIYFWRIVGTIIFKRAHSN